MKSNIDSPFEGELFFRLLKCLGWGSLLNIGFYPKFSWFDLRSLYSLHWSQRELIRRAVSLLNATDSMGILDVGCGGGWGTHYLSRSYPRASVCGIDCVPAHVRVARQQFGDRERLRFELGSALDLRRFADESLDRVLCVEAAFLFGAAGRRQFLDSVRRVLKRNGRLVVVDFTWNETQGVTLDSLDTDRCVRDTWHFDNFGSAAEYRQAAVEVGLQVTEIHNWSRQTLDGFARTISRRLVLRRVLPQLRRSTRQAFAQFSNDDWWRISQILNAHRVVRSHVDYVALVFTKTT